MSKGLPRLTVEELYNISIGLRPDGSSPKNAKSDPKLKNMEPDEIKRKNKKVENVEIKHDKKEKVKPFDPTELGTYEQCNIIIPVNSQMLMKQLKGFKMNLGRKESDMGEDVFKTYLNKNNVIVNKFGVYDRFNIYSLHRGFDPNYVYIFREHTFVHKTPISDKYQAFNSVVEYVNVQEVDEIVEEIVEDAPKKNVLSNYLNKIKKERF